MNEDEFKYIFGSHSPFVIHTIGGEKKPPLEAIATEENQMLQRLARLSRLKELVEKNPEFVEFLALAKEFGL